MAFHLEYSVDDTMWPHLNKSASWVANQASQ